jgi:hemolysin III
LRSSGGSPAQGVLLKSFSSVHPVVSAAIYVGMGWLALAAMDPLLNDLPRAGLAWILAGGLAYTLGIVFFVLDEKLRFAHFVWHLFVLGGSACHFVAVLEFA